MDVLSGEGGEVVTKLELVVGWGWIIFGITGGEHAELVLVELIGVHQEGRLDELQAVLPVNAAPFVLRGERILAILRDNSMDIEILVNEFRMLIKAREVFI